MFLTGRASISCAMTKARLSTSAKAVSLRNRVRSYFQDSRNAGPKVEAMLKHVADFSYIVTDSEVEALILEANLIKEEEPWYNIRLKDDELSLFKNLRRTFFAGLGGQETGPPRPSVRAVYRCTSGAADGAVLAQAVSFAHLQSRPFGARNHRPCLLYHIRAVQEPLCQSAIRGRVCRADPRGRALLGRGVTIGSFPLCREKWRKPRSVWNLSRPLDCVIRFKPWKKMVERQKVVMNADVDQDVLGLAVADGLACAQIFCARRKGRGKRTFLPRYRRRR